MTKLKGTSLSLESQPKSIRVAQVVDIYRLVLNVGKRDGIAAQDKFLIYGLGGEVTDPETNENLGPLELVRGRGIVEHLQDSMCTIQSTMQRQMPGVKKVYQRESATKGIESARMGILSTLDPQIQEVEEPPRSVIEPFYSPKVGDFARKI